MGLIWLAATSIMIVTQIALHRLQCMRLRHYVLFYPIVVSPILIDPLVDGGAFGWMLALSLVLAPGVVVFWCIYALVLRGVPQALTDSLLASESSRADTNQAIGSALAIGLAFVGIFVLNHLVVLTAAPLLEDEEGHPSLLWGGTLAPLVVAYWGTAVHFAMLKKGRTTLREYTLGFLVFVLGYTLFDLTIVGAGIVFMVLGLFAEGSAELSSGSPDTFWDYAPGYVVYCIFPAVIVAGGPLLWWAYHVAVPRILPPRLDA